MIIAACVARGFRETVHCTSRFFATGKAVGIARPDVPGVGSRLRTLNIQNEHNEVR